MTYTDAESLCYELGQGPAICGVTGEDVYVCQVGFDISVVESDCISMVDPSEALIEYHMQYLDYQHYWEIEGLEMLDKPTGCEGEGGLNDGTLKRPRTLGTYWDYCWIYCGLWCMPFLWRIW